MRHRAVSLAAVCLLSAGCVGDDPNREFPRMPLGRPTRSDSLVVALVGTLSGPDAWRGEDAFEGADVAVHELNRRREPGDMPFELVALDDAGDPEQARRRLAEIAGLERAVGVVYAGPPAGLAPAEDLLARVGIPAITVAGDLYGARALTPHIFQASPSNVWAARRLASYFLRDRRYRTIGIIAPRGSEADVAVEELRRALQDRNGSAHVVRIGDGRGSIERGLARLRARRVEGLAVPGGPETFSTVLDVLADMGARYRSTAQARVASAPRRVRRRRMRSNWWRPQVAGFDGAISTRVTSPLPPGTVAADSLARGVHFLPVPEFEEFDAKFRRWWDQPPLGWEQRAYDSALAIGWAARRAEPGEDIARSLEGLDGVRFGGMDIVLGHDDHTLVDQTQVGLWTVPRPGEVAGRAGRRPANLPWVPLARGFAIDGKTTDIAPGDWKHLFRRPPPTDAPPPPARRMRFAVSTRRADPLH
ncbi:MAG TPA: ABC transporter substrate-binding protein [Actinomycetota bacterium]|nr:ABC transporter substrate-binding protein [Actinomycetota bacterium]